MKKKVKMTSQNSVARKNGHCLIIGYHDGFLNLEETITYKEKTVKSPICKIYRKWYTSFTRSHINQQPTFQYAKKKFHLIPLSIIFIESLINRLHLLQILRSRKCSYNQLKCRKWFLEVCRNFEAIL